MIPSAPSSAENLSPVPVRERGRVPINKTILESQRKSPFCSRPCASQRFIFISTGAPDRPRLHRDHNCTLWRPCTLYWCWQHPPRWPPSRRLLPAAPSAQAMSSARGEGRGRLSNKNHPDPHTRPARPGEEKTHNKGIVRSRPGGLGPQTLGYCVPGPGLSRRKAQPLDNGGGGPWGVAEARWSDEGKPDRRTDTSLFQESQEEGEAGLKKRGRGGERPALPRATPVGEGWHQPPASPAKPHGDAPEAEAGLELWRTTGCLGSSSQEHTRVLQDFSTMGGPRQVTAGPAALCPISETFPELQGRPYTPSNSSDHQGEGQDRRRCTPC